MRDYKMGKKKRALFVTFSEVSLCTEFQSNKKNATNCFSCLPLHYGSVTGHSGLFKLYSLGDAILK